MTNNMTRLQAESHRADLYRAANEQHARIERSNADSPARSRAWRALWPKLAASGARPSAAGSAVARASL